MRAVTPWGMDIETSWPGPGSSLLRSLHCGRLPIVGDSEISPPDAQADPAKDISMPTLLPARARRAAGQSPLTSTLAGYKAMLDCLEAKVFVCDYDLVLIYANKAAVREASLFADEIERVFGITLA